MTPYDTKSQTPTKPIIFLLKIPESARQQTELLPQYLG